VPDEIRDKLLNGTDEVRTTLAQVDAIERFEGHLQNSQPWL